MRFIPQVMLTMSILLGCSDAAFATEMNWNGDYHYFSSEALSEGNVATIEIELKRTAKICIFSITGFQVDTQSRCTTRAKGNVLYIQDAANQKHLAKVVMKNKKYYLYSDDVHDLKDNQFLKD